ncbi:MAG TPA: single-stranded DNA-binding protein [Acidothermaceae bacterium]|nr:single-stranded DNA-binding protein [Acidothermaceae bacterium]
MFDTQVTVVGNLVADPRLTYLKDGQPVASFRLASTPRRFDRASGQWKDGDTLFTSVNCWRALAENVYQSLKKGNSIIVIGRLSVRPYETKDGEKRQSVDIDAMAVGPDLARATTIIKRVERTAQASAEPASAAPNEDDLMPAGGLDGEDGPEGDLVAAGGIDWGVSLGEPLGDSLGSLAGGDVPRLDDDGTGPLIDPMAAADSSETALPLEPVAQLASTGGRWRSRSVG